MDSLYFSRTDNTTFIIMKFIPLLSTVFVAKINEGTQKSRISCQQRKCHQEGKEIED